MRKPVFFTILALVSLSLACGLVSDLPALIDRDDAGVEQPAEPGAGGPTEPGAGGPEEPGAGEPAGALFEDDFSDPSSGWDRVNRSDGSTDYDDGAYRIRVDDTRSAFWANPGQESLPGDVRVEVDATKAGGPDNNDFGVICRYRQGDGTADFYQFAVSSDGYAGIVLVMESNQTILSRDGYLQPYDAINQGAATNHITAECVGSTLTLYVNGVQVDSVTDATLARGDVGLIVGSYDEPGVDILFDDFTVTRP